MIIKTVIIDDEKENISLLEKAIETIQDVDIIKTFSSGEEFFKAMKKLKFDLCIIDYHLPGMNGYQCAQKLIDKKIILASPLSIPADEALDLEDVIDVIKITKPIDEKRLTKAIKKVRDEILGERGYVVFKSHPHNHRQLLIEEIVYISIDSYDSRLKVIYTKSEEIKTQKYSFDDLLEKLPDYLFCRVNKNTVINIDYFHSKGKGDSIFLNHHGINKKQIELSISDKYYTDFASKLGIEKTPRD